MKRLLLSIALMLTSFLASAYDFKADGIYYEITSDTTCAVAKSDGKYKGNITIPATVNGYAVTSIGTQAFCDDYSLTSITIPEGVTSIGEAAFDGCLCLTSVNIPEGVTSIGKSVFSGCQSLTSITLPESVTSIGPSAFFGCSSLTSINIPNGVTSIGSATFHGCQSLTSVNIPDGVTSIGPSAFLYCHSLTSINIPDGVTSIGEHTFYDCSSLKSITIPEGVTSIGEAAFDGCQSLTSVNIPESVTGIGPSAFLGCSSLTSINIPNGVTSIGSATFHGCRSLTSINIPNGVTSIGSRAFGYCRSLPSINIPESVTSIEICAFYNCPELSDIKVAEGNEHYTAENGVLFSKDKTIFVAYPSCKGKYIVPDGVTSIGGYAFSGCSSLTSITIPEGLTSIGYDAFSGCSSLTSITIPEGLTSIGYEAFYYCSSLKQFICHVTVPPSTAMRAFYNIAEDAILYVPRASIETYKQAKGWKDAFAQILAIEDMEATPEEGDFTYEITSEEDMTCCITGHKDGEDVSGDLVIPATITHEGKEYKVTSIGEDAFKRCSAITGVVLPEGLTTIGDKAFYECTALTSVTLPESVTTIEDDAFFGCTSLASINIPAGVMVLHESVFRECSSLTSVTIPASMTSIEAYAFRDCCSLAQCICYIKEPPVNDKVFEGIAENAILYVLRVSLAAYKQAEGWSTQFAQILSIEGGEPQAVAATPVLSYDGAGTLAITTETQGAEIHYVLEGHKEAVYSAPLTLTDNRPVHVWAAADGYLNSDTVSFAPDHFACAKPTITYSDHTATIGCATPGAVIYYEVEKLDSGIYNSPLVLTDNRSVTARAEAEYFLPSDTALLVHSDFICARPRIIVTPTQVTVVCDDEAMLYANDHPLSTTLLSIDEVMREAWGEEVGSMAFHAIASHPYKHTAYSDTIALPAYVRGNDLYGFVDGGINWLKGDIDLRRDTLAVHGVLSIDDYQAIATQSQPTYLNMADVREAVLTDGALADSPNLVHVVLPANVVSVEDNSLRDCPRLAAVTWTDASASHSFTLGSKNPNLLYYTPIAACVPTDVRNVVIDGHAARITLTDGGDFHCPQAFTAARISYDHSYTQTTGMGFAQGWETLSLPFDVQSVWHRTAATAIAPFEARSSTALPFWLYELGEDGWQAADDIKAGVPYIISMPNNDEYVASSRLAGIVSFRAENVTVPATADGTVSHGTLRFIPAMRGVERSEGVLAINAYEDSDVRRPGSAFVPAFDAVQPFQAYLATEDSRAKAIALAALHEGMMADAIVLPDASARTVSIYSLDGRLVRRTAASASARSGLPAGIYVIDGRKVAVSNR